MWDVADRHAPHLSEYLYAARQAKGFGVRQAAKAIGISHSRLLDFEAGVDQHTNRPCTPSTSTLFRIAAAYELDVTELLAYAGFSLPGLPLASDERAILDAYRGLDSAQKAELTAIIEELRQPH